MSAAQDRVTPDRAAARPWIGPAAVALAATVATLWTLAPDGSGPGIACDEYYHVGVGKSLVTALRHQGFSFFTPVRIRQNFPWRPDGPPVHPPLGNWVLGGMHYLFDSRPDDPLAVSIHSARFAPALAFGLLVLLVGLSARACEGPWAATVAAAATALVPRVFGHAHLAALDMLTALAFVGAVVAVGWAVRRGARPWPFALAGFVWGLAMLTRLHGLLVFPPVAVWLVWRLRRKAGLPLLVWLAAGTATFFAGWPWLWLAPLEHLKQFLGTSTGRQVIHVFYAGQAWADREVPRHYAPVMFLAVVPAGLLLLGFLGLWAKRLAWKDVSDYLLIMGTLLFVLLVFCLPGTPVYDGARLFLMAFPLWAMLVGAGAKWVVEHPVWRSTPRWVRLAAVGALLALQATGIVVHHPSYLSHYNLLVGGLAGAERLGFEVTYWGETVREPLLAKAAAMSPRGPVMFAPNLAPFQAVGVNLSSPALLQNKVVLVGWDPALVKSTAGPWYALVYNRKADAAEVSAILQQGRVIEEYSQQGVWLARLVEIGE